MPINCLVVDDSKSILNVMSALLTGLGVSSCQCVGSGSEALELIKKQGASYQLIFVDLNMPEMDGMELIRLLSKEGFLGGVVILSQLDTKIIQLASDVLLERRTHLIGCISKPITEEKLSVILKKLRSMNHKVRPDDPDFLTVAQIDAAISDNRIIPYYQPKVDNQTGEVDGLEI